MDKVSWDFEELCYFAKERGADNALMIPVSEVIIDPRVRLKCMIPKCFTSGVCSHCPPYGLSNSEMRDLLSHYQQAVFFRVLIDSRFVAISDFRKHYQLGTLDERGNMINLGMKYLLTITIAKLLEKKAREKGCPHPRSFAAGNCRDILCRFQRYCSKLSVGGECRHEGLSMPSMESCGIDVYAMAAKVGWDVYPVGMSLKPLDIPHGSFFGMTLIA